jgi:hypothetical protein
MTFAAVALAAGQARAACMDDLIRLVTPKGTSPAPATRVPAGLRPAVYRPSLAQPAIADVAARDDDDEHSDGIVGLWEFQIDGFPPDFGTQAWHSDGTELMFSGGRNPASGNVCQGVWRKIGRRTYSLNHIAMGWDPGSFGLRVHIHAVVTLDRSGNSYSGTLTANAYAVTPANPFDESHLVGSGGGNITATRVKPD